MAHPDTGPRMVRNASVPVLHSAQRASLARVSSFSRMAHPPPYAPPIDCPDSATVPEHVPSSPGFTCGNAIASAKPRAWAVALVAALGGPRGKNRGRYLFLAGLAWMCALPAAGGICWLVWLNVSARALGVAFLASVGMVMSPRLVWAAGVAWTFVAFAAFVMMFVVVMARFVGVAVLVWMSLVPWAAAGSLGSRATVVVSAISAGVVVAIGGKDGEGMGIGAAGVFAAWLLFLGCVAVVQTHISLVIEITEYLWDGEEGEDEEAVESEEGSVPQFGENDVADVVGTGLGSAVSASPRRRFVSGRLPPRSPIPGLRLH